MLFCVSRPPVPRRVCCRNRGQGFRPIGTPACKSEARSIGIDELEAIRLADVEGLYQDAAAERMAVSRQTYARILSRGRRAVAECLIEGRMLLVRPAPVIESRETPADCPVHGGPRRIGRTCRCPVSHSGPCGKDCGRCRCGRSARPHVPSQ
jgi:predicted DNA-binding protein (UPF0251 family)